MYLGIHMYLGRSKCILYIHIQPVAHDTKQLENLPFTLYITVRYFLESYYHLRFSTI